MEHPEEHYYKLNRFFLSVSGLWPYQNVRNARLIRAVLSVFILSSVFFQLSSAFTYEITLEYIVDLVPAILPVFGSMYHIYTRLVHIDKFRVLFDRIWYDWALQKTDDEIKIMHEHAETSRLLTFYLSLQAYIIMIGYNIWLFTPEILDVISPMNESRPRAQPFKVKFYIDEERYFYVIRFNICIMLFLVPAIYIATNTLFLVLTQHVCGMCELLGYRAERLFYVVESAAGRDLIRRTKINRKNMIVLVRLHYDIIQFVGIIETTHTMPFLLDLVGIVLVMSFTLTQVLTISDSLEGAIRAIGFVCIEMFYLFICNYMGQRITDKSSSICERVYNSMWYDAIVSEQKLLLLIMRRRAQPLILTACKFYALSLRSFGMILQTSVSYCMFVRKI